MHQQSQRGLLPRLLRFHVMCPSGRVVLRSATTAANSDFRSAFDLLDADRDGKISREDLRKFYAGFCSGGEEEEIIGSMISVADLNRDGFVEYEEFERVLGCKKKAAAEVMKDVFRVMDKDGDGRLSHEDLKSYMKWAGFSATDDDIRGMVKLGGGDENDGVSLDGLLKILAL